MIIPTGWIHAVYTPKDSVVIGGNFLQGLNIGGQIDVYNIENETDVPAKFRYFFDHLLYSRPSKPNHCYCIIDTLIS
jgi:hypothetical protein